MCDNFNDAFASFFDTSDNICENIDWVSSGIQAQIIAEFEKSKTLAFVSSSYASKTKRCLTINYNQSLNKNGPAT